MYSLRSFDFIWVLTAGGPAMLPILFQ
jgi:hypothetical protein